MSAHLYGPGQPELARARDRRTVRQTACARGWGWALSNFRGDFGVLGSNRADVAYEPWESHLLDRKMLDLLQRF